MSFDNQHNAVVPPSRFISRRAVESAPRPKGAVAMTKFAAAAAIALTLLTAAEARADIIYTIAAVFNGATPVSTPPWLTATFHTVSTGTVTLTLQSHLNISSEYIDEVVFNVDPTITPSALTIVQSGGSCPACVPAIQTISKTTDNAQNLTGGGASGFGFDIALNFFNGPPAARFNGISDVVTVTMTLAGLTENSFGCLLCINTGDVGAHIGAHFAGVPTNGCPPNPTCSGAATEGTVPEPASVFLLLTGFAGLMAWRRIRA